MRVYLMLAAVVLAAACGSSSTGPISPSCTATATRVCIQNSTFARLVDTTTVGATVTFQNTDGLNHTVTSSSVPPGGTAFNQPVSGGASTQVTFAVAGTYQYYCTIHGTPTSGMHATIVIQ